MEFIAVIDYSLERLSGFGLDSFLLPKHLVHNLAVLLVFGDFTDTLHYHEGGAVAAQFLWNRF